MRVGFDAYWWSEGPPSGRNVLRSLVHAWLQEFPSDEIHLWTTPSGLEEIAQTLDGVHCHLLKARPHAWAVYHEMDSVADEYGLGALLTQNFTTRRGRRNLVFVHDVLFQSNPEWFTRSERIYLASIPVLARRAVGVLTSSETEASRIRMHNPRLSSVYSVGLGPSETLFASEAQEPSQVPDAGYVVTVGRLNIRKNLSTLLDAVSTPEWDPSTQLVVVGERSGRQAGASGGNDRGGVIWLGRVSDAELRWLYENAALAVFPSLDEGFGMPPHEALQLGCPVAVSDIPVFREVLGGAAEYFDPRSPQDIARTVARCLALPRGAQVRDSASWTSVASRIRAIMTADVLGRL